VPDTLVDVAILPLMLIPTAFGYAIHRYKLMDVDIIFKRGVTYILATASVVTMIVLAGEFLGSNLERVGTLARIGAAIFAALLFSPIKDQFQVWLDKFFYGERYNVRRTHRFGRPGSDARICSIDRDRRSRTFSVTGSHTSRVHMNRRFSPAFVTGLKCCVRFFVLGEIDQHICSSRDVFRVELLHPAVKDEWLTSGSVKRKKATISTAKISNCWRQCPTMSGSHWKMRASTGPSN
jgi:hypothetical protein